MCKLLSWQFEQGPVEGNVKHNKTVNQAVVVLHRPLVKMKKVPETVLRFTQGAPPPDATGSDVSASH